MKGSLKIGEPFGIGVFVHWTFSLLIAFVVLSQFYAGAPVTAIAGGVVFVLAVFGCVLLHELGHALAARRYGIPTLDITLLPIGGVARLQRMPEKPSQEMFVALAGPAVNVVIAALLVGVLSVLGTWNQITGTSWISGSFLFQLLVVNILLVAFNMLPAFPMDGGRVFRALMATRMDYVKATQVAATVGRSIAVVLGVFGLFSGYWMLALIAAFIFFAGGGEARMAAMRGALRNVRVGQLMANRFRTLTTNDTVSTAAHLLMHGSQQDFPVTYEDQVVGMLPRGDLQAAAQAGRWMEPVGQVMRMDVKPVDAQAEVTDVLEDMQVSGWDTVPVVENGRLVGLLRRDNIEQWMAFNGKAAEGGSPPAYNGPDRLVEAEVVATNVPAAEVNGQTAAATANDSETPSNGKRKSSPLTRSGVSDALLRGYCDTFLGSQK